MTDSDRESLIDASYDQMISVADPVQQRKHFSDMCWHIRLRSPEQILKMESERRISAKYAPLVCYQFGDVA